MISFDQTLLDQFRVFEVSDSTEVGPSSRVTRRFPSENNAHRYQLLDRGLIGCRFSEPINRMAMRQHGDLLLAYVDNRFATQVEIDKTGVDRFCFMTLLSGTMQMVQAGRATAAGGAAGLAYRGHPGTRFMASDDNARVNLWFEAGALERTLEAALGERLRQPLAFEPVLTWDRGLAASLHGQLAYLLSEMRRPDGLTSNAVALRSFTDLLLQTALQAAPHNYTAQLAHDPRGAIPAYLRRAEELMRARAATPLRLEEVAQAAGCSLRTLSLVFRRFRGTSPLATLQAIRLDEARAALLAAGEEVPVGTVARRYGFTNAGRFAAAYRRRFGNLPHEHARAADARLKTPPQL